MSAVIRWVGVVLLIAPFFCFAEPPSCYAQLEREFFNPVYVNQALSMHNISQSAWPEVNRILKENSAVIPARTRALASKQRPNPFNPPFDGEAAAKILTRVQLEVLSKTLVRFQIQNPYVVQQIYGYIKEQQQERWNTCFGLVQLQKK